MTNSYPPDKKGGDSTYTVRARVGIHTLLHDEDEDEDEIRKGDWWAVKSLIGTATV